MTKKSHVKFSSQTTDINILESSVSTPSHSGDNQTVQVVPPASHVQQQQESQIQIQQPKQQGSLISISTTNSEIPTVSASERANQQSDLHGSGSHVDSGIDLLPSNTLNLVAASTSRQKVSNSIELETNTEEVTQT